MKVKAAQNLLKTDISKLNLEAVQKHKVKLLDAWRESRADYGMQQAVMDGYYVQTGANAKEFTPKDMWLTHNLSTALDAAEKRERELLA